MELVSTFVQSAPDSVKKEWRIIKTIIKRISGVSLSLCKTNLSEIPLILKYFKYLSSLNLSNNKITKISLIYGLNLKYLYLENNIIYNIDGLKNLKNLHYLNLSNNKIIDISVLGYLKKLSYLSLNINNIINISVLRYLKNLRELDLSENYIKNISALKNLKDLSYLGLNKNFIKKLPYLNIFSCIVHLSDNKISNINKLINKKKYIKQKCIKYMIWYNNKIFNINNFKFNYICHFTNFNGIFVEESPKNTLLLLKQKINTFM